MRVVFLILFSFNFIYADYIRDNAKEVVIDTKKNLMWQDNKTAQEMNWYDAIKYCTELNFASFNDWRLPKVDELNAIVDVATFKNINSSYYWTSTSYRGSDIFAWHLSFENRYVNINIKKDKDSVRCVR